MRVSFGFGGAAAMRRWGGDRGWKRAAAASALVVLFMPRIGLADWSTDPTRQMLRGHHCEIVYLINLRVQKLDGAEIVLARVLCTDGRAFGVSRTDSATPFRLV